MKRYAILSVIGVVVIVAVLFSLRPRQRSPFLQVEAIAAADSLEAALTALDREVSLRAVADSVASEAKRELAQARKSAIQVEAAAREYVRQAETRLDEVIAQVEPEIAQEIQEAIVEERSAQASVVFSLQLQLSLADSMTAVVFHENVALRSENAAQSRTISAYERGRAIDRAIIQELEPGWYDHWLIRGTTHAAVFYLGSR